LKISTLYLSIILLLAIIFASCGNVTQTIIPSTQVDITETNIIHISPQPTYTIPKMTNSKIVTCSVLNLEVPEQIPPGEVFSISITLMNTSSEQENNDIPIIFTDLEDPTVIITWMINVTLNAYETKEVIATGICLEEARYKVEVGNKRKYIDIYVCGYY